MLLFAPDLLTLRKTNQQKTDTMKNLFYASILGMAVLTSCGPSAEEKAAKEKATADSLAQVAAMDSANMAMAAQATADSLAKVAEEARLKASADSLAAAEAAKPTAKAKKK